VLAPRHCRCSRQEIKCHWDAPGASGVIPAGFCRRQGWHGHHKVTETAQRALSAKYLVAAETGRARGPW